MNSAGKLIAVLATLVALGAVGMGYWFWSASRAPRSLERSAAAPAGVAPTNAASTPGSAAAPGSAPSGAVDFGPDMNELGALQNSARAALQARHWDEAASAAQKGLKLVESRAGVKEPLRILFLGFQAEADAGAKRFPEATADVQALVAQMDQSPAEWQNYMVTVHRVQAAIAEGAGNYVGAATEWAGALEASRKYPKLGGRDIEALYLASGANDLTRAHRPADARAAVQAELDRPENNQSDAERIEFRLFIARRIRDDNLPMAQWLAADALHIGRQLPDARLNPDAIEAEVAVADIDYRSSGRQEPEVPSSSNPEAAKALDQLQQQAEELTKQGKPRDALELMAKRLGVAAQSDGRESIVFAMALDEFASAASYAGLVEDAEKAHRQAIAVIEAREGRDGSDLAAPISNLATLLFFGSKEHASEVETLWRRSLAISEKFDGPLNLDSLTTRANLGYTQTGLEHWEQAERSFREAIAIAAWHGDVSEASSAWFGLFELRRDQGRLDEAEPFVMRCYEMRAQELGMRHPKTRMTLNNVVWLKRQLGHPKEALPYLETLAKVEDEIYGPSDMRTFMRFWDLAGLYAEVGDWQKSEELGSQLESQTEAVYSHPLGDGFDPRVPR